MPMSAIRCVPWNVDSDKDWGFPTVILKAGFIAEILSWVLQGWGHFLNPQEAWRYE